MKKAKNKNERLFWIFLARFIRFCAKNYLINDYYCHQETLLPIKYSIEIWREDLTDLLRILYFNHVELPNTTI